MENKAEIICLKFATEEAFGETQSRGATEREQACYDVGLKCWSAGRAALVEEAIKSPLCIKMSDGRPHSITFTNLKKLAGIK